MPNTAAHILEEMKLYYEELRDINTRTISIAKLLMGLVLGLLAYMFFGMQQAASPEFAAAIGDSTDRTLRVSHIGITYGIIGICFTLALQAIGILAITSFGTSRLHKTRYWRSISLLRRYLHHLTIGLDGTAHRAITLQTGLEIIRPQGHGSEVPSPLIRPSAYRLGYFLAAVNLFLFTVPFVMFVGMVDYCRHGMIYEVRGSLWSAIAFSVPILFALLLVNSYFAVDYCRTLKSAQFVTPTELHPRIPDRTLDDRERTICRALRILAWGGIAGYTTVSWLVLRLVDRNWLGLKWLAYVGVFFLCAVLLERVAYVAFRQQSLNWWFVRFLWRLNRPGGKIKDHHIRRQALRTLLRLEYCRQKLRSWYWKHPVRSATSTVELDIRGMWDCANRMMREYRAGRRIRSKEGPKVLWERESKYLSAD